MKRILTLVLLLVCAPFAAAADDDFFEYPVLVFSAPEGTAMLESEMNGEWYYQELYCAGLGETILCASYPTEDEMDACIGRLFGDVAATAVVNDEFEAVQGRYARWSTLTVTPETAPGIAPYVDSGVRCAANLLVVYADRVYLFAAVMPEDRYDAELIGRQVRSVEIFDPYASVIIMPEGGADADSYVQVGELVQDAGADAFLLYALNDIRKVRLTSVGMDEQGRVAPEYILDSWDSLSFGEAIRVQAYLPDALPGFALIFYDASDIENTLYVTFSGIDGTLMLID